MHRDLEAAVVYAYANVLGGSAKIFLTSVANPGPAPEYSSSRTVAPHPQPLAALP